MPATAAATACPKATARPVSAVIALPAASGISSKSSETVSPRPGQADFKALGDGRWVGVFDRDEYVLLPSVAL